MIQENTFARKQTILFSLYVLAAIVAAILTSVALTKTFVQSAVASATSPTSNLPMPYQTNTASSTGSCTLPSTSTGSTGDQDLGTTTGGMGSGGLYQSNTSTSRAYLPTSKTYSSVLNNYITNTTDQVNTAYINSNNIIGSYNTTTVSSIKNSYNTHTNINNHNKSSVVIKKSSHNVSHVNIHNNTHNNTHNNIHNKTDNKVNNHNKYNDYSYQKKSKSPSHH